MNRLRRLAARAPVAVFAAVGHDAAAAADALFLHGALERASSPRHATVLLVAGEIRDVDRAALRRVHDQLPHPRATLWWGCAALDDAANPVCIDACSDPAPALCDLHARLFAGRLRSEGDWLADEPPAPWRGLGEHGQGGKGMMGGKPYGRPMAMTADDVRDGLALDRFEMQIGPFVPTLPPGLVLGLALQGDVVQHAEVVRPPLPWRVEASTAFAGSPGDAGADDAGRSAAAHALRCVARVLLVCGLVAQSERCRRVAWALWRGERADIGALRRSLQRSGAVAAVAPGLGRLPLSVAEALGGAARRAARGTGARAHEHDVHRARKAVEPQGPDARDRLLQWLDDAERRPAADEPPARVPFRFTDLLVGLEWIEASLVVGSFDEAALRAMSPGDEEAGGQEAR